MTIRIAAEPGRIVPLNTRQDLAARIDDTRLVFKQGESPEAVVTQLCQQAAQHQMRAVCVRPQHVALAKSLLKGLSVLVATVIGFPKAKVPLEEAQRAPQIGNIPVEEKIAEMRQAIADGADELDVVMNVPEFLRDTESAEDSPVQYELASIIEMSQGRPIKLIIETDLLNDEDIARATRMAINLGIAYVKTSTGMLEGGQGATTNNVSLIRRTITESPISVKPGIKASGGIRSAEQAYALIQSGADIIGSSAGVALLDDFDANNHKTFNT